MVCEIKKGARSYNSSLKHYNSSKRIVATVWSLESIFEEILESVRLFCVDSQYPCKYCLEAILEDHIASKEISRIQLGSHDSRNSYEYVPDDRWYCSLSIFIELNRYIEGFSLSWKLKVSDGIQSTSVYFYFPLLRVQLLSHTQIRRAGTRNWASFSIPFACREQWYMLHGTWAFPKPWIKAQSKRL